MAEINGCGGFVLNCVLGCGGCGGCVVVAVGCLQWLLIVFDELYILF